MAASITIVHRGVREKLSFDKSRPLFTAMEMYCSKYGLDPATYRLMSGRVAVDLGTPFQFGSVLNNALLELEEIPAGGARPSGPQAEVKLTITVSPVPPGGSGRVEASFPTASTLADVLVQLCNSGALGPAYTAEALAGAGWEGVTVVYVRTAVKGAALATSTLASLGLLKGAAGLRLTLPPVAAPAAPLPSPGGAGAATSPTGAGAGAGSALGASLPSAAPQLSAAPSAGGFVAGSTASAATATADAVSPAAAALPAAVASANATDAAAAAPSDSASSGSAAAEPPAAKRARGSEAEPLPGSSAAEAASASASSGTAAHEAASAPSSAAMEVDAAQRQPGASASGVGVENASVPAAFIPAVHSSGPSTAAAASAAAGSAAPAPVPALSSASAASVAAGPNAGAAGGGSGKLKNASVRAQRAIGRLRAVAFDADSRAALRTVLTILDNLIRTPHPLPNAGRVRALRLGNPKFAEAVGRFPAALEVLRAAGFAEQAEDESGAGAGISSIGSVFGAGSTGGSAGGGSGGRVLTLSAEAEDDDVTMVVREAVAAGLAEMGVTVPPAPEVDYDARDRAAAVAAQVEAAFDPYKAMVVKADGSVSTSVGAGTSAVGAAIEAAAAAGASAGAGSAAGPLKGAGSGSGAGGARDVDRGDTASPVGTVTDRLVRDLRQRAVELQRAHRPTDRRTRVRLYVPPEPVTAAASAAGGGAGGAGSAAAAGAGGSSAAAAAAAAAADAADAVEESDPEVQRLMAEYARKKIVEANSGDKPLKTAAQRELETLRSSKVFTATAVKVQLPDRTVLQGVFSPLDSLAELHAWVRAHLSERARALPYYLYSAPPPTQYRDEGAVTLGDAKLVPAKLLHFAFGAGLGARLPPGSLVYTATGAPVDGGSAAPASAAAAGAGAAGAGGASGAASGAADVGSPAALPEGVVAVPSTAEELLHPDALAMAIAALTAATASAAAAGAGGEVASPSEGTGLVGSAMSLTAPPAGAGAVGSASGGGAAAGSGRGAAPADDVNDADLERMAAALLSGDMSALQQRATARPAAGGAGAGAGAGAATAKGKPSWLRI